MPMRASRASILSLKAVVERVLTHSMYAQNEQSDVIALFPGLEGAQGVVETGRDIGGGAGHKLGHRGGQPLAAEAAVAPARVGHAVGVDHDDVARLELDLGVAPRSVGEGA